MPFWKFFRNWLIGWICHALLVQPSICAHRKWPEMVVSASTNQLPSEVTPGLLPFRSRSKQCALLGLLKNGQKIADSRYPWRVLFSIENIQIFGFNKPILTTSHFISQVSIFRYTKLYKTIFWHIPGFCLKLTALLFLLSVRNIKWGYLQGDLGMSISKP